MVEPRKQMRGEAIRSLLPMVKHSKHTVPAGLGHLIALRASVLNDCKACIATHRRDARADGLTHDRILAAEDWTNHKAEFTGQERAVLALTDAITHIDGYDSVPDELWHAAVSHFGDEGTHDLVVSICAINAFNRVSIATRTDPQQVKGTTEFDLDFSARWC